MSVPDDSIGWFEEQNMTLSLLELLQDHAAHPRHYGPLEQPTVVLEGGNAECGDIVTIYLKIAPDGQTIEDVQFTGFGCSVSQAAASLLMERLHRGKWTIGRVATTDFSLVQDLVGVDTARLRPRCASLALSVLKAAVHKFEREQRRARTNDATKEGD